MLLIACYSSTYTCTYTVYSSHTLCIQYYNTRVRTRVHVCTHVPVPVPVHLYRYVLIHTCVCHTWILDSRDCTHPCEHATGIDSMDTSRRAGIIIRTSIWMQIDSMPCMAGIAIPWNTMEYRDTRVRTRYMESWNACLALGMCCM